MIFTGVRRFALLAAVIATGAAAGQAQAAEGSLPLGVTAIDAPVTSTLTVSDAVRRDCTARSFAGRRGVAQTTQTLPADGFVTARLSGTGDWDLALFDAASGRLLASSSSFGANEVAQAGLRRGASVLVQACRRTGGASAVTLSTQLARVDLARLAGRSGRVQVVRVTVPSRTWFERLEESGLDVTHDSNAGSAQVVTYGPADLLKLRRLGLPFRVEVPDLVARTRATERADAAFGRRVGLSALPTGRTTYRSYEHYQAELKQMVEQFPDLAQPVKLKQKSFQGRDIQVVEIAQDVKGGDDGRPVFFLGAVHHAREWPAAETAMEFAWDLLKNHGTDANLARILSEVRVVVMPLTNPDGFVSSRTAMDPDGGTLTGAFPTGGNFAYRRKNCNPLVVPSGAVPCEAAIGVDNNRNYATEWGGPGASTTPIDQSYRGPGPSSEPETKAVIELLSGLNAPVHISAHNVAAKVLRPPGLKADGFAPDEEAMKALGQLMAGPTGYTNEYGWQLYDTTGTTKDWGYDALGQYSYTVELGPAGGDFHGAYKTHVIEQYLPTTGAKKGRGLREAYIKAALYTRNEAQTGRLTGTAPAGATLRLTKDFASETYPVCTVASPLIVDAGTPLDYCAAPTTVQKVPEHVEITMTVPASGQYAWWLNPSTRPFAKTPESYTLTCETGGAVRQTTTVFLARGETKALDLPCGG
jgi:hypothetical protein